MVVFSTLIHPRSKVRLESSGPEELPEVGGNRKPQALKPQSRGLNPEFAEHLDLNFTP